MKYSPYHALSMSGNGMGVLMELSGLDSKKYQAILNFKRQVADDFSERILSENAKISNKQVDEYGELVVNRLSQTQKEFSESELKEMASLYQSGKTTRELGEMFKVSKTTITKLLRKQGVEVTKSKVQARLNAKEIISMYKNGYTAEKIAKHFEVCPQTILDCLRS